MWRCKNPEKKPSKHHDTQFRAYGEKKPLQGSCLNFALLNLRFHFIFMHFKMPYLVFLRNSNLLVARQRYHSKCIFAVYSLKFLVVLNASGRVRAYTSNCTMFCTRFTMLYSDSSIHSTVMRVSHNLEIWSRDPGHAHLGVVVWLGRSRVGSTSEADISVHSKLIRVFPTFRNSVTWPRPRPL